MANKSTPAPQSKHVPINEVALLEDRTAANQLAVLSDVDHSNVKALALKLKYSGPLEPDALEQIAMGRAQALNQVTFEFGAALLLLRESTLHGNWTERLERMGVAPRTALQYMTVAAKFSNQYADTDLRLLGKTKLMELVALDDEEVAAFASGESVRGLVLDKVAQMGVRELRAKLRNAMGEAEANEKLLAKKDEKINKLSRHIAKLTPDDKLAELEKECTQIMTDAVNCLRGQMYAGLMALKEHDESDRTLFMAGLVGQVQFEVAALREAFNLPDVGKAADLEMAAEVAQWMPKKKAG